jgi:hypothetical protein
MTFGDGAKPKENPSLLSHHTDRGRGDVVGGRSGERSRFFGFDAQSPESTGTTARAATLQERNKAKELANELRRRRNFNISDDAVERLFDRFWRQNKNPDNNWQNDFRYVLKQEADAIDRYRERRRKWDRQQRERKNAYDACDFMNRLRNRNGG